MDRKIIASLVPALLASLLLAGCISSQMGSEPIKMKRLNLVAQNFTELIGLGFSLMCDVQTANATYLVKVKDGKYRYELGDYAVVEDGDTNYLRVPPWKKAEFDCDWIMVNESEYSFTNWLREYDPLNESLDSLPASSFNCDAANVDDSDMNVSGKICWIFDLK